MARVTLGLGVSHGPMLSTPPEQWDGRVAADRQNPDHAFRGGSYTFDELVELRSGEHLSAQIVLPERVTRHAACQRAIEALAARLDRSRPDILVLVGNDQREIFTPEFTPTFSIFCGETIRNPALSEEHLATLRPGLAVAHWANSPDEDAAYPGAPDLGRHVIGSVTREAFDVAAMSALPEGPRGRSLPHAFGFLYRRIMQDRPIPAVLVVQNTFFPPNQPSAGRCFELGRAIGRAIASWPSDRRVGIIASGGLSHFVIDEEFDRQAIAAMQAKDKAALERIPADRFRSGTSETKNWITAVGALAGTGLEMTLLDYVPCYRSEAGTGNAMAFATWD